jgi:DNA replication protein DnaC
LDSYSNIELTDDEVMEAMIWRKQKKAGEMEGAKIREQEAENRKRLTAPTTYDLVKSLMLYRAEKRFGAAFVIDKTNEVIFESLCRYFGNDKEFVAMMAAIGVENPSLDKGIFLAGNFGCGKTWMMNLFKQNQRHCFALKPAKEIANGYRDSEEPERFLTDWATPLKNAYNDATVFFQPFLGVCIDDIGSEDLKNTYGNKANVIGDLIELRYAAGYCGPGFHATTNLTADQLLQYYGGRVTSRMKQIFNFIELPGADRRI